MRHLNVQGESSIHPGLALTGKNLMRNSIRRPSSLPLRATRHNPAQAGIPKALNAAVFGDAAADVVAAAMDVKGETDARGANVVRTNSLPGLLQRLRPLGKVRRLPCPPAPRNQADSSTARLRDISRSCFPENRVPSTSVMLSSPQRRNGARSSRRRRFQG